MRVENLPKPLDGYEYVTDENGNVFSENLNYLWGWVSIPMPADRGQAWVMRHPNHTWWSWVRFNSSAFMIRMIGTNWDLIEQTLRKALPPGYDLPRYENTLDNDRFARISAEVFDAAEEKVIAVKVGDADVALVYGEGKNNLQYLFFNNYYYPVQKKEILVDANMETGGMTNWMTSRTFSSDTDWAKIADQVSDAIWTKISQEEITFTPGEELLISQIKSMLFWVDEEVAEDVVATCLSEAIHRWKEDQNGSENG